MRTLTGTLLAIVLTLAPVAQAQDYPTKPIRIITAGVGGATDFAARTIAPGVTAALGQQIVVDNRASGVIPGEIVAQSKPDGYTLLFYGPPIWLAPFLLEKMPYDPVKDLAPVILAVSSPAILVVHPSLPVKSVNDLIALARSKPGQLNYGTSGTATTTHISGELFKSMAGLDIVRVNYKGAGALITDLLAGQLQFTFATATSVSSHIKEGGRLRALAVTSAKPSPLLPGLPTVASAGLPDYVSESTSAMFAPAGTPKAIIDRLNQAIVGVLNSAEVKERFFRAGSDVVASTPEQLASAVNAEIARLVKVIRDPAFRQ